ncbi:MAG TPA: phosphotransferase [Herpetosiphonaceae bacterium]|nr:phosphotransferase [Herpetosiphonaceae bacterium]
MSLDRADVNQINQADRELAFAQAGLTNRTPIAAGTEAEVYAIDDTILLKLYAGAERRAYFATLRSLYDTVDASKTGFGLPRILDILPAGNCVAVIETRLPGRPLDDLLPGLGGPALRRARELYLDTACALGAIELRVPPQSYLLFDQAGRGGVGTQSFAQFYAGLLGEKIERVGAHFSQYDPDFGARAAALVAAIRTAPPARIALVHGDFFPGNILVNDSATAAQGVIDFGSFTMFGDHLLDLAIAFGFYRMYDRDRRRTRAAMLPDALGRIAAADHPRFFQFLLANALLTADLYAPGPDPRGDGHFQWAAEIAAQREYWRRALG